MVAGISKFIFDLGLSYSLLEHQHSQLQMETVVAVVHQDGHVKL